MERPHPMPARGAGADRSAEAPAEAVRKPEASAEAVRSPEASAEPVRSPEAEGGPPRPPEAEAVRLPEDRLPAAQQQVSRYLEGIAARHARYRAGELHVHLPPRFAEGARTVEELVAQELPASQAALDAASDGLFYSLPVAFDPAESVGPYLATVDRDPQGEPYRFMDLGALIASQPFGENDPALVASLLAGLPYVASRYAHSEYQTALSLRVKNALRRIAPQGTPRFFVVNTGAETVENAMKAVLLNRVKTMPPDAAPADGAAERAFFVVSFEGAFHGRTLGALAVTHRKKARLGFPTFDWPHVLFPVEDPQSPARTQRRDEKTLEQLWILLVTGRVPGAPRPVEQFRRQLAACDALLASLPAERAAWPAAVASFVEDQRALIDPAVLKRAQRVAGVLVEPVQGEGGLRFASASFFRRLRLLTRIYDVPLLLDEVQTGWGATGRLWAHEHFDLPCPPDAVMWAKKAQNGILFVSEDLATFFQEEKKFNTTWEGDSVGMLRLLSWLDRLDLEQVRRTGALAREGLEALARDHKGFLQAVRGMGCMLAFDVARADWRDWLRDRAFRRGLLLLPAGERTLRFYPRYDMEPSAVREALALLRQAVEDLRAAPTPAATPAGPERRVGTIDMPPGTLQVVDLQAAPELRPAMYALEAEAYGPGASRQPFLQYAPEVLEATLGHERAVGLGLRDRVTGRLVAYAIGSPLENHHELGAREDPGYGDNDTLYLQAMAVSPALKNQAEVEALMLDAFGARAAFAGFAAVSTLIEARVLETGPAWIRAAAVLETAEDYLETGGRFVYLRARLDATGGAPAS